MKPRPGPQGLTAGRALLAAAAASMAWFSAPAAEVVLSEIMYDPAGPEWHDEYVELQNTSPDRAVDLTGWRLGDPDELDGLAAAGRGLVLPPGGFALILDGSYAGNSTTYDDVMPEAVVLTIEDRAFARAGWPNSRDDTVILCDAAGDTVATHRYASGGEPGFSWERVDPLDAPDQPRWERALVEGGTPGRANSVSGPGLPAAGRVELTAAPNPFDDAVLLSYSLPAAPSVVDLWIYGVEGVRVRRLMNSAPAGRQGEAEWDGRDHQGVAVPPGIYIVYLAASAAGKVHRSKTLVVRR